MKQTIEPDHVAPESPADAYVGLALAERRFRHARAFASGAVLVALTGPLPQLYRFVAAGILTIGAVSVAAYYHGRKRWYAEEARRIDANWTPMGAVLENRRY